MSSKFYLQYIIRKNDGIILIAIIRIAQAVILEEGTDLARFRIASQEEVGLIIIINEIKGTDIGRIFGESGVPHACILG